MEKFIDSVIDFVRVRQLNIALAGLLTLVYVVYQYWGVMFKAQNECDDDCPTNLSRSRSRSFSRSRTRSGNNYDYKSMDSKRRGRKSHRRCPDCSQCNLEK